MTELAALLAQLSGQNQQPAPDPALAAARLARASLDALVLTLGQSASQPSDIRTDAPVPRSEFRVEIPMLPKLAAALQRHGLELGTLPASASTSRFPSSSTRRRPRSSASCCEPAPASAGRRKPACIPRPGGAN